MATPERKAYMAKYCATPEVRARHAAYRQTPEGKIVQARHSIKRRLTPEYREYQVLYQAQYRKTPEAKIAKAESALKYSQTAKGIASQARRHARRRERSTNPELYAARVELLHILKEPCAVCGMLYKVSHTIDHIKALCNGGTDTWTNFRPICLKCHKEKNNQDMTEYFTCTIENTRNKPKPSQTLVLVESA